MNTNITIGRKDGDGFTLVEVIVAMTVSAILAVVLVQFFSVQTSRSWQPIQHLNQGLALQSAMDQITSDYRNLLINDAQPLVSLQRNITNGSGNYWPNDRAIQVLANHCFDFNQDAPSQFSEGLARTPCLHTADPDDTDDTLLKVTLSFGDQSLTTIFSR